MRTFKYYDPDGEHFITEDQIIEQYFEYWKEQMSKVKKDSLINRENCIQDFCVINWATELKTGGEREIVL